MIQRASALVKNLKPEWDKAIFSTNDQTKTSNEYFLSSGDKIRVFMEEDEETAKGEVSIHQDATFLYTDPISVTGFWFAMQDATLQNGCLWALPSGHRLGLASRFHRKGEETDFEYFEGTPIPRTGYIPLEVSEGTLVLLYGLLPHYSEANLSSKTREAYAIHMIERDAFYPNDNWLQRGVKLPLKGFEN